MDAEQIIEYIKTLIPEEEIKETDKYYILPTICHNEDYSQASHKLYLYKNPDSVPLFTCYTDCAETFNVYTFIQKYWSLRGENLTYKEAYKKLHGLDYKSEFAVQNEKEVIYNEKFINPLAVQLPEYDLKVLNMFNIKDTDPWALEGIDLEILKKYQISYSKSYEGVMIPHFDWRGRFIGLRIRTYNEEKEKYAKYMPAHIGNILYRHPLSMNFFGIFQNQNNIKKSGAVILAESEKAVLQWETMAEKSNIALGVCGSNISKWQMDMLIYFLGVSRVYIAFDKEYTTYTEAFKYVEKIKKQAGFLMNFADVFVLIDENNIFQLKESPFDRTLADFHSLKLWKLE